MADEYEEQPEGEIPLPTCRHLLICHNVWKSQDLPNAGFSLGGLLVHAVPDVEFPVHVDRLFLYAQVYGPPGEYQFVARLVRIDDSGYGEEVETPLGEDGEHLEYVIPRPFEVSGLNSSMSSHFRCGGWCLSRLGCTSSNCSATARTN